MDISMRLKKIASMVDKCESMVDVGTDHAYVPIYLLKNNICNTVVASDINKGPVEKARLNLAMEGFNKVSSCRLGGGLSTVKPKEVNCAVIAGMGGNLIRDIIEADMKVFKSLDYAIVQPVQNPEVFREYIYSKGFSILDEALVYEENKFYEILKIKYAEEKRSIDSIYYEVSELLIKRGDEVMLKYMKAKMEKYRKIHDSIKEETELALSRKAELKEKIVKIERLLDL